MVAAPEDLRIEDPPGKTSLGTVEPDFAARNHPCTDDALLASGPGDRTAGGKRSHDRRDDEQTTDQECRVTRRVEAIKEQKGHDEAPHNWSFRQEPEGNGCFLCDTDDSRFFPPSHPCNHVQDSDPDGAIDYGSPVDDLALWLHSPARWLSMNSTAAGGQLGRSRTVAVFPRRQEVEMRKRSYFEGPADRSGGLLQEPFLGTGKFCYLD